MKTIIVDGQEFSGPDSWSDRALSIFARHYANIVDGKKETSVEQACQRVAFGIFGDTHSMDMLYDALVQQKVSFNSPTWYNLGVTPNPMLSACYILGVEDNLDSIYQCAVDQGRIFKSGGGAGVNVSALRRRGAPLTLGGTASGPVSFMGGWDALAGVIKSGGHHRRAAMMVIMNSDHPDIDEFIRVKVLEERKAKLLADNDLISRSIGERSVAYQNMNLSVLMVPDQLNNAGKRRDMFMTMAQAAWECGDPGVFFFPAMQKHNWLTGKSFTCTNPCGEVIFIENSACNLATVNLNKVGCVLNHDDAELEELVALLVEAQDRLIDLGKYPTEAIEKNSHYYRPIGVGFTGLGSVLFRAGWRYGSPMAKTLVNSVTKRIYEAAKQRSADLAALDRRIFAWGAYKLKNAQLTVAAPEGTRSLVLDSESTGIEPILSLSYQKKMVSGEVETMLCESFKEGLTSLGYKQDVLMKINSGMSLTQAGVSVEHQRLFQTALGDKDNPPLHWKDHLEIMASAQPNITGGISKTINVPNETSAEEIAEIFEAAYQMELKSVTVYRDGSKYTQPLTTQKADQPKKTVVTVPEIVTAQSNRKRLPATRQALTHRFELGGTRGYLTIGLYPDGGIGEVFCTISKDGSTLSGFADAFSTLLSFALQYGIPLEDVAERFMGTKFEPHGFTDNKNIPTASSIIDYLFRWLLEQSENAVQTVPERAKVESIANGTAKWKHTGDVCATCGALLIATGRCKTCTGCGLTTGCGG